MRMRPKFLITVRLDDNVTERYAVSTAAEVAIVTHKWAELREQMPEITVSFVTDYTGRNYERVVS